MEMRLRVLDGTPAVDKYGLNAWIFDSTNDGTKNYDKVLFSTTKSAADSVGILRKGEWADVKVKIVGGRSAGLTAGFLVKVEELTGDLSRVRLFHTSVSRAIASWPTWPGEPGFTGDFAEYLAQKFPTSTAADFAILEAGVTSEETYVQQGLYWKTGHEPMLEYVVEKYDPDLLLAGMPTTDEFQHQFLGLVSPKLPNGAANPAYDDVDLNGVADGRVAAREAFIRTAYQEADEVLTRARELMGKDPTTFVASDHGFAPQFLAIDASLPLVELGLLSRPQTSNCRPATGETIGKAKACWAGGALQIYLNVAGRDPAGGGFQQVAAGDVAATVAAIKAKYLGLKDPNDWTHDGQARELEDDRPCLHEGRGALHPERAEQHERHGASDPHGRPGRLRVPAVPVRRGDAGHAGRAVALLRAARIRTGRPEPSRERQHAGDVPRRRREDREGRRWSRGRSTSRRRSRSCSGSPSRSTARAASCSRSSRAENSYRPIAIIGLNDFHGQLDQTTLPFDGSHRPWAARRILATMFDEETLPGFGHSGDGPAARRRRQRRRLAAELGAAPGHAGDRRRERVGSRRDVVRQPRVRLRRRAAARSTRRGRTSRSWRRTSSTR